MAKLKVFNGTTFDFAVEGVRGQRDCMMATTSQKKFMDRCGCTRGYFGITGNEEQIRICMETPETVFVNKSGTGWPRKWVKPDDQA